MQNSGQYSPQKNAKTFLKDFFRLLMRGAVMGAAAFLVFFGGIAAMVAYGQSSSGGRFWEILNKILASGNWQTDDTGTVKNAEKLGGQPASAYQKISSADQQCGAGMCMVGFSSNGTILCQ